MGECCPFGNVIFRERPVRAESVHHHLWSRNSSPCAQKFIMATEFFKFMKWLCMQM